MYLDPDFEKHPTIYAAKSLIAYHHINNCVSPQLPLSTYDVFKVVMPTEPSNQHLISVAQDKTLVPNDDQYQVWLGLI